MPSNLTYTELLYAALYSRRGIVVETDDFDRARQLFYRERAKDEALQVISILQAPWAANHIILLRNKETTDEG